MDSIQTVKSDKWMAMRRYRRIQKLAFLFRFLEACVAIFLLGWFSSCLPVAADVSGDFFQELFILLASPRFVFFFGNAIVLTLFVKSGHFSGQRPAGNPTSAPDLYDEFLKNSERSVQKNRTDEETVYEDKYVCVESTDADTDTDVKRGGLYRRSLSEGAGGGVVTEKRGQLRRSETDVGRKGEESGEMSNEEFRRTIEEFIAKQLKFQREESMAVVLTDQI